jgi:chromosome segregation ATPase
MSSEKSNGVSSPYDSLKNVLHHLTTLASRPELQNATTIFDEIDHHKRQIKAEKEELAKGQNQNQAAIEAIMKLNEKSKIEQKSIETENISLQSNLKKKEKGLEECSQQIKSLRAQLAKLQSDHSKEVANVAQCCRDITGLHETLKKKDTEYDKVLNDRSNLKATLSTEQKKIDNLKNDLISLREEERKSSSKLKKLEGFTVGYSRVDEELM